MATTSTRRPTKEIVDALVATVRGVQLPGSNDEPAFGRVELFDSENLPAAFQFLTITAQRVCLVIPLAERFEKETEGTLKVAWRRTLPVALICSDAVLGDRESALWGATDGSTLGASGLVELILPVVTGQLLPNPGGVIAEPKDISPMIVENMEKNLPGRAAMVLEVECRGGVLEMTLARGPVR